MNMLVALIAAVGTAAVALGADPVTGTLARAPESTPLVAFAADNSGFQSSPDDDSANGRDDDRPYRNAYRQGPGQGAGRGGAGPGAWCTGYADANGDGVCDNCSRTPRGCPAGPQARTNPDPYTGMPATQDYERLTTLENMQAAFNGESNARAKYLAFAEKADEEGYVGVASLFRAAATAEGVHAENHAEVIRQLGGTPNATIQDVEIGTTRENLESAIAGESYEWDIMYPGMLSRARLDRERAALRSFNFAMTAERDHARLYRAALADLDNWKIQRDFFVCTVCGETVDKIDFKKCPSCFVKVDEYVKVS